MNLIQFLKKTDAAADQLSADEMRAFIHEIARILPEKDREHFLNLLQSGRPDRSAEEEKTILETLVQEHDNILQKLDQISEGEICLKGCWDYDSENYDFDAYGRYRRYHEEQYFYRDPDHVADIADDAVRFVKKCADCEAYDLGNEIIEALSELWVDVEDEEYDADALSLKEMSDHKLLCSDYDAFVCDAVFIEYHVFEMQDRPQAVYGTLLNFAGENFALASVMQGEYEIQDIEEFLPIWVDYLGQKEGETAWSLLLEAVKLINNAEYFLNTARKYCENYPALYEKYLEENPGQDSDETLYQIGREALDQIRASSCMVRSRIALDTASRALRLENTQGAEECWLEAFRSDPSVLNYLRLRMEHHQYEEIRGRVRQIYQDYRPDEKSGTGYLVYAGNRIHEKTYYMLHFLEGNLEYVIENGMNLRESIGWSMTFMKTGLSMMLILLTGRKKYGSGCQSMMDMVVSGFGLTAEKYQQGTLLNCSSTGGEFFRSVFERWKESILLSEETVQKYLGWADELVDRRVQGILDGKYRNYYRECAAYVAALGEAKESNGVPDGRQREIQKYRKQYSRYNRFMAELRAFG